MGPQKGAAYTHVRCLRKYLEREKERGREAEDPTELLRQIEVHSAVGARSPVSAEDLTELRAALGPPS
jgi:hypothetical protein